VPDPKKQSPKGELRRRHREWLHFGRLAALGSEGRLVACYALYWADFETCTVKMSARGAAKMLGVRPTSVTRGLRQLVEAGMFELVKPSSTTSRAVYEIKTPTTEGAHATCTGRTRSVSGAHTQCVQGAHVACAPRTRSVGAAHTGRRRLSIIPIGIPKNTNEGIKDSNTPDLPGQAGEAGQQQEAAL